MSSFVVVVVVVISVFISLGCCRHKHEPTPIVPCLKEIKLLNKQQCYVRDAYSANEWGSEFVCNVAWIFAAFRYVIILMRAK